MRCKGHTYFAGIISALLLAAGCSTALAQGTAFTYQGQLKNTGVAVNTSTDMKFSLWTDPNAGSQVGSEVEMLGVGVSGGLFTTQVDFGVNPYASAQTLWLQIKVRNPAGAGSYVPMGTRQKLTPAPFSLATRGINVDSAGKLGIGTPSPSQAIDLVSSGDSLLKLETTNGTSSAGLLLRKANAADWQIFTEPVNGVGNLLISYAGVRTVRFDGGFGTIDMLKGGAQFRIFNGAASISEMSVARNTGDFSSDANANDVVWRNMSGNSGIIIQAGSGGSGLWVNRWNNVGIGMGPAGNGGDKLRVNGSIKAVGQIGVNNVFYGDVGLSVGMRPGVDNWSVVGEGPAKFKGYTAIGTGSFQSLGMLEVRGALNANIAGGYYFNSVSTGLTPRGSGVLNVSLYADAHVTAPVFVAFSDARTKTIVGRSDAAKDLSTIMNIEITDYTFKDVVAKGTGSQKKVIAQQVERIYPQAVVKSTDVVPDIYKQAAVSDGWITLATDLKVGEKVRLIGEKEEGLHDVLEVRADGSAFRTAFSPSTNRVFVYGRQVKDFMSVDYEAIAMLNVSATQELARQVMAQQKQIEALQSKLDEQAKSGAAALSVRLEKLEAQFGARASK